MKENKRNVINGAKAILKAMEIEGIDTIFGYPGGAIMPLYDEIHKQTKIKHYLARHEQGAAHAAQAYAMVTGKVGVCLATSGPGATNLVTGIVNAQFDSVPMVFITAQVVSPLLGSDAFQETDVVGITMPVTKWNYQLTKAEEIPEVLSKAFYVAASGRSGVVVIDITKDAQIQSLDFSYKKSPLIRSYNPYPHISTPVIEQAAELINKAKKPLILAGRGILIAKASEEIRKFAEKTSTPVACTLLGLSAFPSDHELFVGMLGMHGNYAPNVKTNESDLIIAIGMRFDDRVTGKVEKYAKQAKIIHIEIDNAEIDKIIKTDVAINADLKTALTRLLPRVEKRERKEWLNEFKVDYQKEYDKVIAKHCFPKEGEMKMGEVVNIVSEKTNGEAIVVTDVGQQQMASARYYKFRKVNSIITSGGLGTMGFGLPASIGAKIGQPERQVVAFLGDGGTQMTIQELGTIMQYDIPVKVVILNNQFLGMVRQWQDMFFDKRYAETNMQNPDFIKIAEAYGIKSRKISERKDLSEAIDEMLAYEKSYILEVKIQKEDNIFPMIVPGASVSDVVLE